MHQRCGRSRDTDSASSINEFALPARHRAPRRERGALALPRTMSRDAGRSARLVAEDAL